VDDSERQKSDATQSRQQRDREQRINDRDRAVNDHVIEELWLKAGVDLRETDGRKKVARIYRRLADEDDGRERNKGLRVVAAGAIVGAVTTGVMALASTGSLIAWIKSIFH